MTQGPVAELPDEKLKALARGALVNHVEALYRRQDCFDDHECHLRRVAARRNPEAPQPPREHPVPRYDDRVLASLSLQEVVAHARALQRRLRDYLDVFHRLWAATDPSIPQEVSNEAAAAEDRRRAARTATYRGYYQRNRAIILAKRHERWVKSQAAKAG